MRKGSIAIQREVLAQGGDPNSIQNQQGRKRITIPYSKAALQHMLLVAKSTQILASSKASSSKMHCYDLWGSRMQKEAVNVLLAKHDPKIRQFHLHEFKKISTETISPKKLSSRTLAWLTRNQSIHTRNDSVMSQLSYQSLPEKCQSELNDSAIIKSRLSRAYARLGKDVRIANAIANPETDLSQFMNDEIREFRSRTQLKHTVAILRHSVAFRLSNKKKALGIQFYEAQRRKDAFQVV